MDFKNTKQTITCYQCEEQEYLTGDFYEAIADAKSDGWANRKDCGEWKNLCEQCAEDFDNDS